MVGKRPRRDVKRDEKWAFCEKVWSESDGYSRASKGVRREEGTKEICSQRSRRI